MARKSTAALALSLYVLEGSIVMQVRF